MGTILAKAITTRAARALQDPNGIRWQPGDLLDYLNDGQREIGIYRPDAITVVEAVSLVAGAIQALPPAGIRLVDVLYNAGVAGLTQGTSVTVTDRDELDSTAGRNWRNTSPANDVDHYIFDGRYPTVFGVYPPNTGSRYLMIAYQKAPTDCTINGVNGGSSDSVISLNDIYETALLEYLMHRAYLKDTDVRDANRASNHYSVFVQRLGMKLQADKMVDPNRNAAPSEQSRGPGGVSQRAKSF